MERSKKTVYYSEFGAKGDGINEDFSAIVKCHEYANANGCTVKADKDATYYIGETDGISAIIKTDVDWDNAVFVIDDRNIAVESKSRTAHIFNVESDYKINIFDQNSDIIKKINSSGGLRAGKTKNIGYAPGYTALIYIRNDNHSAYVRYGVHATGVANPLRELIVVDKDGNITPDTDILLDFEAVTHMEELRADDEPITIRGGKFITRANAAPPFYTAYARGILFRRANVTIKDTVHQITDEGPYGAPYGGFISWHYANSLLCENLTLQSHKSYKDYEYDENGKVIKIHSIMGSYDIGGSFSTNIKFKNCVQSNFYKYKEKNIVFNHTEYWGIMGTNYCKNLTYDGCMLSRLDAHAGVYNITIKDTLISEINLIGGGVARIEGSKIIAKEDCNAALLTLRDDYGSTWKGDIIIKDCEFINWSASAVYLVSGLWNNWDFGYITHLPSLTVDNLKIDKPSESIYAFTEISRDRSETIDRVTLKDGTINKNPMDIGVKVEIKNNTEGYKYQGSPNAYVDSKITVVESAK